MKNRIVKDSYDDRTLANSYQIEKISIVIMLTLISFTTSLAIWALLPLAYGHDI